MSRTAEEWGRLAVSLPGWRWMPGMRAMHPDWQDFRVAHIGLTGMHGVCRYSSPMGGVERGVVTLPVPTSSDVLADPDDPATAGCLLALLSPECHRVIADGPPDETWGWYDGEWHDAPSLGRACIAAAAALGRWPGGEG